MGRSRSWVSCLVAAVGIALLWSPATVFALGLGKLSLYSTLDEPLNAEIELTAVQTHELKTLKAGLAARGDFESAGVERLAFLNEIKYAVVQRPDGRHVLRLSTDQPVREPFLHLLLQVDWVGGRLIREYTALLDPPHLATAKAPEVSTPQMPVPPVEVTTSPTPPPVAAQAETPEPTPTEEPKAETEATPEPGPPAEAPQETTPATVPLAAAEEQLLGPPNAKEETPQEVVKDETPTSSDWATASEYGPTKRGDTLWKIVEQLQRDKSLSPQQVMLALLKANQTAFINNNVNHLKTGKILKVPERPEVEAIPEAQALKEFRAQYDAWKEYKLKLASAAQTMQVAAADKGTAKGEISTKKPEPTAATDSAKDNKDKRATPAPKEGEDLLKIVRGQLEEKPSDGKPKGAGEPTAAKSSEKGASNKEYRALQDKVTTLEEALESKQMENKELRERVSQIETQLKNTKRLIELENKELALAQKQAAESPKPVPDKKPPATTSPTPPPKPAAAPAPPPAAPKATPKPAETKPATAPPSASQGDLVTTIENVLRDAVSHPMLLPLGIGVLVVVIGSLFVYMRRRRRSMTQFEESILSGGGVNSEGMGGDTSPQAENAPASVLSEFSQGGMGNIHTDEVDPVAEAEVYLAYGRDEQAEEILKEAMVKDPTRHELRAKLLEIYHQRNDLAAFETVAEELYASLEGKGGKVWQKVEEMGRKMNPQNPLFKGGAAAAATATRSMPSLSAAAATGAAAGAQPSAVTPLEQGFDLDLKGAGDSPAASELSFDLDFTGSQEAGTATAAALDFPASTPTIDKKDTTLITSVEAAPSIDLDFSLLENESTPAPAMAADGNAASSNSIDFDLTPVSDMGLAMETETATAAAVSDAKGEHEIEWNFDTNAAGASDAIEIEGMPVGGGEDAVDVQQMDEIATKLDLAKAYIDMGDAEGARSILDEVLVEGNDVQKKQAADLAAQIS